MEFCCTQIFTLDRDNCLSIICYTVLTMYMADNRLLDMYGYTFYPLCDPPHKLPTTCSMQGSQHNQYSNNISNLEIVHGCEGEVKKCSLCLVWSPNSFDLSWSSLGFMGWTYQIVLFFLFLSSFLIWTCWNLIFIQLSTGQVSFPVCQHFIPTRRQRCITLILFWRNNVYKQWIDFNVQ